LRRGVAPGALAEEFVAALLDAEPARMLHNVSSQPSRPCATCHLGQLEHVYPMSGVLASWPLDFVGKLEDLPSEWAALQAAHRNRGLGELLPFKRLNLTVGGHMSSQDPFGMREALRTLLDRRADLRTAICTLLLPDYKCFNYDFAQCTRGSSSPRPYAWSSGDTVPPT